MQEEPKNIEAIESEAKNPINKLLLVDKLRDAGPENKESIEMFKEWYIFEQEKIDRERDTVKRVNLQFNFMLEQFNIYLSSGLFEQASDIIDCVYEFVNINTNPNNSLSTVDKSELLVSSQSRLDYEYSRFILNK